MGFEECLIRNASPVLVGIKTANLFNFTFSSADECNVVMKRLNREMNAKGVYIELLKNIDSFYLMMVYRKSMLRKELQKGNIKDFLYQYGYVYSDNLEEYLGKLKERICKTSCFPHEIGVFLGYPLEDVKAFIENAGRDFLLCGEWKVYHDESAARKRFCQLHHCKDVCTKLYLNGRSIYDMTINT